MCSSISESEASAPTVPTCSWSTSALDRPWRLSDPTISQFCPADVPLNAGSVTERFSFPSIQKYDPTSAMIRTTTSSPAVSAIRRPRLPGGYMRRNALRNRPGGP